MLMNVMKGQLCDVGIMQTARIQLAAILARALKDTRRTMAHVLVSVRSGRDSYHFTFLRMDGRIMRLCGGALY